MIVRTSSGVLYAVIRDATNHDIEVWYSADGTSWSQKDAGNSPTGPSSECTFAIDSNDILHIVYTLLIFIAI